jgi:hypothetical protein
MRRLFVFGCSYTAYSWPTWADLLSINFDYFENWGLAGIGNRGIAERIAECNIKNTFNADDTIIVQWSTHLRNDFFHQEGTLTDRLPGWKTAGSIFNYLNSPIYDANWCRTFFDEEAYFMHTLNNITSTQNLLENTGATWFMTSIGDVRELGTDLDYKREYGESSIFSSLKEKLFGSPKHFGYEISPALELYDEPIWGDHKDQWLSPIHPYITAKKFKDPFFRFPDEFGTEFEDQHFKTAHQAVWLTDVLLPKLGLLPDADRYKVIADRVDEIFYNIPSETRFKREFEKELFRERFRLPRWPNMIKGYYYFKEDIRA